MLGLTLLCWTVYSDVRAYIAVLITQRFHAAIASVKLNIMPATDNTALLICVIVGLQRLELRAPRNVATFSLWTASGL